MAPSIQRRLPGEIWGVAVLFDWVGVPVLWRNLDRFARHVRAQGLKLLVVELAFGDAPFRAPSSAADLIVRHRTSDVMWQKERLINLGVAALPDSCDKVVGLDADILFENADWVARTAEALETFAVVQPFDTVCWLAPGQTAAPADPPPGLGEGRAMPGMAAAMAAVPDRRRALADFRTHGHCGMAWAARREILQRRPLYDRHVLGGGDVTIAHSLYGDTDYWRGLNMFCRGLTRAEVAAIAAWGRDFHAAVGDGVSFTPGRVLHLWHGALGQRGYLDRGAVLREGGFDPASDVALDSQGCLAWASAKPDLHERVRAYFQSRAPVQQLADA